MREIFRLAAATYRNQGTKNFVQHIVDFFKHGGKIHGYQDKRTDNEQRWNLIYSYLCESDETFLDIGCAQGYFTYRAAKCGLKSTGIDTKEERLITARRRYGDADNISFVRKNLNPDNINELPNSDVTLLLSVHHHWSWLIGFEEAIDMFETVAKKSGKLFYEPSGTQFLSQETIDPEESMDRHTDLIKQTLPESVEILHSTMVHRKEHEAPDPFFVIDTSEFKE